VAIQISGDIVTEIFGYETCSLNKYETMHINRSGT